MLAKALILFLLTFHALRSIQSSRSLREIASQKNHDFMRQIQKIIDIPFEFQLPPARNWLPFPQMKNSFTLEFSQYVVINIRVAIYMVAPCRMKFRLTINGVESRIFRREVPEAIYITFLASEDIWLELGNHTIQLEYTKTGSKQLIQNDKVNLVLMKLEYLEKRKERVQRSEEDFKDETEEEKAKNCRTDYEGRQHIEPNYPITLLNDNAWRLFPQFQTSLNLPKPQTIQIIYKTTISFKHNNLNSHFVMRGMIDNKQFQNLRTISGPFYWVNNFSSQLIELEAGQHKIWIQYRTPGPTRVVTASQLDYTTNYFEIRY